MALNYFSILNSYDYDKMKEYRYRFKDKNSEEIIQKMKENSEIITARLEKIKI